RITLKAGQKQTVEFTLTPKELQFLDRNLKPVVEPGEFIIYAGTSSDDALQTNLEVVKTLTARPVAVNEGPDPIVEPAPAAPVPTAAVSKEDDAFLEDLQRKTFQFFWDHSDASTGLTLDRSRTEG